MRGLCRGRQERKRYAEEHKEEIAAERAAAAKEKRAAAVAAARARVAAVAAAPARANPESLPQGSTPLPQVGWAGRRGRKTGCAAPKVAAVSFMATARLQCSLGASNKPATWMGSAVGCM